MLAVAVLAVGVGAWLLTGGAAATEAAGQDGGLPPGPIALIGLGLLLVTLTPLVQLVAACVAFARLGERRQALLTAVVVSILAASAAGAAVFGRNG